MLRKTRTRGMQDWCHPNRGGHVPFSRALPRRHRRDHGTTISGQTPPAHPHGSRRAATRRRLRPCAQRPSRPTERRDPPCKPRATRVRSPYGAEIPRVGGAVRPSPVPTEVDRLSSRFDTLGRLGPICVAFTYMQTVEPVGHRRLRLRGYEKPFSQCRGWDPSGGVGTGNERTPP